ncbi:MAG TPA: hypothetical protein DCM86_15885 [Verrucomicrobiales bacterium]|nr:hypothetical protein [Verrucomicrobiales bacterium]
MDRGLPLPIPVTPLMRWLVRHPKIKLGFRTRVTAFVVGILLVAGTIVLGTWTSWMQIHTLRALITSQGLGSNDISDQFRNQIGDLNTQMFRYAVGRDRAVWNEFTAQSRALDTWIDVTFAQLTSRREKAILKLLDPAFDDYRHAAESVEQAIVTGGAEKLVGALAEFERQAALILKLGAELAEEHQSSVQALVEGVRASLERVMLGMLFALSFLLLAGGWLAWTIYRELIAPLRVQLIESRMLVERHEKLVSLGMLAAGVAHEIRNPLTAIKVRLFSLRRRLIPNTQDRADTDVIESEISRLERIVRDFLHFARPVDPDLLAIPAIQAAHEVCQLLGPALEKRGVRLTVEDPGQELLVRADLEQIKQVLINLVQNAADATPPGGRVTLRARADLGRLEDRLCEVVVLEVRDTGAGIALHVQDRLFDPFFTTKEGGTGLGLSIAARIVEKHGGALQFQTQVGEGTTFGIRLPRHRPSPSASPQALHSPSTPAPRDDGPGHPP